MGSAVGSRARVCSGGHRGGCRKEGRRLGWGTAEAEQHGSTQGIAVQYDRCSQRKKRLTFIGDWFHEQARSSGSGAKTGPETGATSQTHTTPSSPAMKPSTHPSPPTISRCDSQFRKTARSEHAFRTQALKL